MIRTGGKNERTGGRMIENSKLVEGMKGAASKKPFWWGSSVHVIDIYEFRNREHKHHVCKSLWYMNFNPAFVIRKFHVNYNGFIIQWWSKMALLIYFIIMFDRYWNAGKRFWHLTNKIYWTFWAFYSQFLSCLQKLTIFF